jgi:GTP 3',8-cyclase
MQTHPFRKKLVDTSDRLLNYLRVSVTDRCNLRCLYCVPNDRIPKLTHDDILSYEEILRVIRIGVTMGINKVRVTGGEPLVRKGIYEFLSKLARIDGIEDISLTTNGILLGKNMDRIIGSGVKRLNISLDSLVPEKFAQLTGMNAFHRVWSAIESARDKGMHPIKINVVALKGYNEDELVDFARLTFDEPYHVRYIEYMPIGASNMDAGQHLLTPDIKAGIETLGTLEPVEPGPNDGPAKRYKFKGARGEIGFISAMSHHFCSSCNRLRLTAAGNIRSCLLSGNQVDLRTPLRKGCTDNELAGLFLESVRQKPSHHQLSPERKCSADGQMSSIGG